MKTLVLVDFDGTITSRDSLAEFIWFSCGPIKTVIGSIWLAPLIIGAKMKWISADSAKEKILSYFFEGKEEEWMISMGKSYCANQLPKILKKDALKALSMHRMEGHKVCIVSASIVYWIKPWTETNGIDLIATQLEVVNSKLTGKYNGRNCNGQEKVNRIKEKYQLSDFQQIIAYGDTSGDKEMLNLADKSYFRFFKR